MNKYKILTIIGSALCAISIITCLYPLAYIVYHQDVPQAQKLFEFCLVYLGSIGASRLGALMVAGGYTRGGVI